MSRIRRIIRVIGQSATTASVPAPVGSPVQSSSASSTTVTLSNVTVPSGGNKLLVVGLFARNASAAVTSFDWGATAMSTDATLEIASAAAHSWLYFLRDPTPGTADVVAVIDTAAPIGAIAQVFENVADAAPSAVDNNTAAGASSITTIFTPGSSTDLVVDVIGINAAGTLSTTGGATKIAQGSPSATSEFAVSWRIAGGATSDMSWSVSSGSPFWAQCIASFASG